MTTTIKIGWAPGEDDECFSLVEATDPYSVGVIEFILDGNQDYVNGFVAQLIGNYPTEFSHGQHELDITIDAVLHDGHTWHDDRHTQEAVALSACRYIIKMENFGDYGVYLTTDDIESFVAGMRAVPKFLHLHAIGEDGIYHIVLEQTDSDWETLSPVVDMRDVKDPEEEIDEEQWSWAPRLDSVAKKFGQEEAPYTVQ